MCHILGLDSSSFVFLYTLKLPSLIKLLNSNPQTCVSLSCVWCEDEICGHHIDAHEWKRFLVISYAT